MLTIAGTIITASIITINKNMNKTNFFHKFIAIFFCKKVCMIYKPPISSRKIYRDSVGVVGFDTLVRWKLSQTGPDG